MIRKHLPPVIFYLFFSVKHGEDAELQRLIKKMKNNFFFQSQGFFLSFAPVSPCVVFDWVRPLRSIQMTCTLAKISLPVEYKTMSLRRFLRFPKLISNNLSQGITFNYFTLLYCSAKTLLNFVYGQDVSSYFDP